MLATQKKHLVINEEIITNSIICIQEYTSNVISNQKVLIIMNLDIIQTKGPEQSTQKIQSSPTRNIQSLPNPPQQQQTYGNPPQANQSPPQQPQNIYDAQSSIPSYGSEPKPNPYSNQSYGGQANNRPISREDGANAITPISAINPYSNK
jgi:hypothetical protein